MIFIYWIFIGVLLSPLFFGVFCNLPFVSENIKFFLLSFFLKIPLKLFNINIKCEYIDNLELPKKYLIIANHSSGFDIIALILSFKKPLSFVVKSELYKIPILNIWLNSLNCISIKRENLRQSYSVILKDVSNVLDKNIPVVIFPQGTRKFDKNIDFKAGSFKAAFYSKVPVIPVAIYYSNIKENKDIFNIFNKKEIVVKVSNPIYPTEYENITTFDLCEKTSKIIKDLLISNKSMNNNL